MKPLDEKALLAAFRVNHHPDAEPSSVELAKLRNSIRAYVAALDPAPAPLHGMECASAGCGKPAAVHFIRGDIGSYYCVGCYLKVQAIPYALPAAPMSQER